MTWWHSRPDAVAVIRKHWTEAELLLLAERQPCIKIRQDELAKIDRVLTAMTPDGSREWTGRAHPHKSWFAAAIICAGDETARLAAAVKELHLDPARFHFYLHKDAGAEALKGWTEAGFGLDAVDEGIRDWATLYKRLGMDFNVQIVNDFADMWG